jgi:hypothetical protein
MAQKATSAAWTSDRAVIKAFDKRLNRLAVEKTVYCFIKYPAR